MAATQTQQAARPSMPACPHCRTLLSQEPLPTGLYNCKGCGAEIEAASVALESLAPAPEAPVAAPAAPAAPVVRAPPKRPPPGPRDLGPRPPGFTVTERYGAVWLEWPAPRVVAGALTVLLAIGVALSAVILFLGDPGAYVWAIRVALAGSVMGLLAAVRRAQVPKFATVRLGRELLAAPEADLDPTVLAQVYVREVEHHYTTHSRVSGTREHIRYSYDVRAKRKNGEHLTLVDELDSMELALHIEREIEKHYRIADARILYEVPR